MWHIQFYYSHKGVSTVSKYTILENNGEWALGDDIS